MNRTGNSSTGRWLSTIWSHTVIPLGPEIQFSKRYIWVKQNNLIQMHVDNNDKS